MAGWRRLVRACAPEGSPGSGKRLKRGRERDRSIAGGVWGLRQLKREETEDPEGGVNNLCLLMSVQWFG